jgi:GT2 family glycosyltransferase
MTAPDVSILIVNWNTRELVLACLDALPRGVDDGLVTEVIVVDNGSVDGSADALAARPDIELIRNADNLGFAAAVNQAYRRSGGEFVLLLNSDVDLTPGALSTLTRFLRERPDAAGVAPLYVNPDGSPQPFHFRFPTFATTLASGSAVVRRLLPGSDRRLRAYTMADEDVSRPRPGPPPSASCLLLRRTCLPDHDLLDERYPIFFNDVKLARTLAARGLVLWVTPEAVVVHEAHSSARLLGFVKGRRQYLGSAVRMLSETESAGKVWVYRAVVFLQNLVLWAFGRPEALRGAELWKALSGDPGPLPSRPSIPRT